MLKSKATASYLAEDIIEVLKTQKTGTVGELYRVVKESRQEVRERAYQRNFIQAIKSLEEEGLVELNLPPPRVSSYLKYMLVVDENFWFLMMLGVVLVTIVSIYIIPGGHPFSVVRWLFGSIFILFMPGYVSVQALYPVEKDLERLERFALSIGLSLAITPLLGLILNYTPWGIRLNPIVLSLTGMTVFIGILGTYRRYNRVLLRLRARERSD